MGETLQSPSAAQNVAAFTVSLDESVDISGIEALYKSLEQALGATESTLRMDAEHVDRVDGAALQLLAVFCREARARGYSVTWDKPSSALRRAARLIGLAEWLGLNDTAAA